MGNPKTLEQEEQTKALVEMWNQSMTARQIGAKTGRTRNSVLGSLHRHFNKFPEAENKSRTVIRDVGTPYRHPAVAVPPPTVAEIPKKAPPKPRIRDRRKSKTPLLDSLTPKKVAVVETPPPPKIGKFLWELKENQCRYSIDYKKSHIFCGAVVVGHTSWCDRHSKLVNIPSYRR